MENTDDDKLVEYSKLTVRLREAHKAADGSASHPGLYLAAAEAIEYLVARSSEAREDF